MAASSQLEWDAVLRREDYSAADLARRDAIADAAKFYDWPALLGHLAGRPGLVNSWRAGGTAWFTPLHQAAHGGAPVDVVEQLLALGAWRSLPTAAGELAVDLARQHRHDHLIALLAPRAVRAFDPGALAQVQVHFHAVIRGRIARLEKLAALRLPELALLTEHAEAKCWFAVPGMYGGFSFHLTEATVPTLVSSSWSRVVEGSGQRHEITPDGARLIEDGFV